ncbi:MAG TPA: hypothetical protein VL096_12790 [Pirellulaceae bacterium]|nr:hypothetical protein [Pirellulaceae bacterium]
MDATTVDLLETCVRGSHTGAMTFPEIVARLASAGVERYHADYSRGEITYYFVDGQSLVIASPHAAHPTALGFSAPAVEAAVRQSQRGEHTYADFVRKTQAAGCVGYFVQLTGRRAIYFGRTGDSHVELFPTPATVSQV